MRDGNRSAGIGSGMEEDEQRYLYIDGYGHDRSVGSKADIDRTGVSVWRPTWTGQEGQRGGGHGQGRSVGVEANTGRTGQDR